MSFGKTDVVIGSEEHMKLIHDRVGAVVNTEIKFDHMKDCYKGWAPEYDRDMETWGYRSPEVAVSLLKKYSRGNQNIKILDVTAGTGMTGKAMSEAGYKDLDAVDGNEGMLEEAKKKGVYSKMTVCYLGHDKLDAPDNTYDITTMFGSLCDGHINPDCFGCLREFCRVTKSGGYFLAGAVRECVTEEYKKKLDAAMEALVTEGLWCWEQNELVEVGKYGDRTWVLKVN